MPLTEFDNRKLTLINIVNNFRKKDIDVDDRLLNLGKSFKILSSDVDNRIHRIIGNYKPKAETECVSILNAVKNQPQRLDKALSNYCKRSKSVGEIEYYYDEARKYSKSEPEEDIAERVKLNTWKRKKQEQESKSKLQTNY